jgi:glycosyltransferase involved in cell wall biosynthesis
VPLPPSEAIPVDHEWSSGLIRVLSCISAYPPSVGGAQLHAHELNRHLLARGVNVSVATVWRTSRTDWLRGTTVAAPAPGPEDELDGVPVSNLGLDDRGRRRTILPALAYYAAPGWARPRLTAAYSHQVRRIIARRSPDVAHLSRIGREWFYEAFVRELRHRSIPYVLSPNHHPHWTRRRDRWWWDLYRRAAAVLVLSDAEGEQLTAGGVDPSRIIRTVVGLIGSPVQRETGTTSEPPTVTFLGQIRHYKRVDLLYDAMLRVWDATPSVRLQVVGPWTEDLPRLRRKLERDARVEVTGAVSDSDKWSRLARSTILCVPSQAEALGGVYLEGWAVRVPAVGCDIPPVRELFSRTGGGVAVPPEATVLASTLTGLLADPLRRAELGERGLRALHDEYNWETAVNRALEAYSIALR